MLLLIALASAQTFDATGPVLPADGASPRDPLTTFGGRPVGEGAVTVVAEGAYDLLVREVRDGPFVRIEPVVENVVGLGLSGSMGITRRLGLAATAPIWLASTTEAGSGAGLGDVRIWAPYSIAFDPDRHGVSVVPFVRLPTGARSRYLGGPFAVGALGSFAVHAGPFTATSDVGFEAGPGNSNDDWPGGVTGLFAGTVGLAGEQFGTHVEFRSWAPIGRDLLTVPSEALLTFKGTPVERLSLAVGGGTAVTRGPGAAAPRFFVSATWSFTPVAEEDTPIAVVNVGPVKEIYVVDERSFPISDVAVTVGRTIVPTGPEGFADVPLKAYEREGRVTFEHPAYLTVERADLDPDASYWQIVMKRRPVPVAVSVVGPDGEPMLTGAVELRNAADASLPAPSARIDALGIHRWELPPGSRWVAVLTADRMGGQARVIDLPPQRTEPIRVDVVLDWAVDPTTNLTVTVVDGVGAPVEDAAVAVEDRDFGTTGPGGEISINGLARGEHEVTVRSSVHGDARVADVTVGDDSTVEVTLDWPAGAVVTRVSDANGQPLDATVRFSGPAALPERRVGSDGVELLVLRPGDWTLRIESGELAAQERRITVTDEPGEFQEVVATLLPVPPGKADVVVRVTAADGSPMAGVAVELDGAVVGETGEDGLVTLLDLSVGEKTITANGELLVPSAKTVELVDGRQVVDVPVAYVPGVVDLRAEANGQPVDVTITPAGDREVAPIQTGADGEERVVLTPGTWELEAVTADGTVRRQTVVVDEDDQPRQVLFQVLDGPASVDVVVVDDAGVAVAEAEVRLDGMALGRTDSEGRLTVSGVQTGPTELVVEAEGQPERTVTVDVPEAVTVADVPVTADRIETEEGVDVDVDIVRPDPVVIQLGEPTAPAPRVSLIVAGPDGPVVAAVEVRSEAGTVARQEVAAGGSTVALAPGSYRAIVAAPGLAPQEVAIEVAEDGASTAPVAVTLAPAKNNDAIVFAVEDVEGVPVADAPVFVDGEEVGRTSAAGTLTLVDVAPRSLVTVSPTEEGLADIAVPARAARGATFVAEDAARPVKVQVLDGDVGKEDVVVSVTDTTTRITTVTDGTGELSLPPGTWSITAETGGQTAAQTVVVPRRGAIPTVSLTLDRIETTIVDGRLQLVRPLLFDLDSASLRPDASEVLDDVARLLTVDRTAALVEVAGHTDDLGGVVYNQGLSERRAQSVRDALVARGVEPERLLRRGYGLSRPLAAGEEGRDQNRRVELVVLETAE